MALCWISTSRTVTESSTFPAAAEFGLNGFSEAGICTRDVKPWLELLTTVGGWTESWRGNTPVEIMQLWGSGPAASCTEILLSKPNSDTGLIRLFQFQHAVQQEIRPGSQTWDSGGLFDLDIRVPDVLAVVEQMESRGWQGISQPIDWQFGEMQVREWLVQGPDSVVLALIERIAPPLANARDMSGFGHVFNSSQIVADMDEAIAFYRALGFAMVLEHSGPLSGRGGEVLGLPASQAPQTPIRLVIMQPEGVMSGSIELVSFEDSSPDYHGQDLSGRASPVGLGLNLLRFPVADLERYANRLSEQGIRPQDPGIITANVAPIGKCKLMAVRTPGGAWLEFYQAIRA
jgi:catechol 2,3-dioxygenase-like lactoylglutathione lyase family enzyme